VAGDFAAGRAGLIERLQHEIALGDARG
jgi:hypothetical protein